MITHQDLLDAGYKYRTFPSHDEKEMDHLYTKIFEKDNCFPLDISIIEWSRGNPPKSPNQCSAMVFGNSDQHWQYEFMLNESSTIQSMEQEYHRFHQLILTHFS